MMKTFIVKNSHIILLGILLLASCKPPEITTGLKGRVLWYEGDMMPGIDLVPKEDQPIERDIYIYEPTSIDQAKNKNGFFFDIQTPLVQKISSDKDGYFSVELPAGTYSVFVMEEEGLYANRFDMNNNINTIEVKEGEVTEILLKVDHQAAY